ncbi:MAG: hypothetical protein ABWX70_09680, partial [Hyphomicrobium sp.]
MRWRFVIQAQSHRARQQRVQAIFQCFRVDFRNARFAGEEGSKPALDCCRERRVGEIGPALVVATKERYPVSQLSLHLRPRQFGNTNIRNTTGEDGRWIIIVTERPHIALQDECTEATDASRSYGTRVAVKDDLV